MASSHPKLLLEPESEVEITEHLQNSASSDPVCVIYSNHPLALCLIKDAVCSDSTLRSRVRHYSNDLKSSNGKNNQILIIDTWSVEDWAGCLKRWCLERGRAIALIPSETRTNELELQMLYLGASGVLTFVEKLLDHLPRVVHAVAEGRLWIRREVLTVYIQWANTILRTISLPDQRFTNREKQIVELLQKELSNRTIAQKLSISERTAKFHVSNILRKLNVSNRRELQALSLSPAPFCPDWLLRHARQCHFSPHMFPGTGLLNREA